MTSKKPSHFRTIGAVVAAASFSLVALNFGAFASAAPSSTGSWPYANANLSNTRDATSSTITLANVSTLKKAWSFKLSGAATKSVGGFGTLAANPIVVNGLVYLQDLHSNVYAVSLATGKLKWKYTVNKPELSGPGPNGVAVVGGVVYGASPKVVFALNATTGKKLWANKDLLKKGQGTFGIQPQVANGRVYLASQYGIAKGGGELFALTSSSGKLLWKFATVPHFNKGVTKLGLGAGGAWETPLVSSDGSVSFGIGNPYQSAASAIAYPAKILYTDSVVNLNAATGKLRWYYQGVPNDFKDYDMQASPIATTENGTSVVIGGGKMGDVYEMNATTGKLLWKTPVGAHNGHDNDSLNALEHKSHLAVPFTYSPGALGGILTNMAVSNGSVYVATSNVAFTFTAMTQINGAPKATVKESGDVEALNLATGKVEWDAKVKGLPLGAATVSNNLVFTTIFEGSLVAFNRATGALVYTTKLPRTSNSPLAIAGNTVLVALGGPKVGQAKGASQLVAYSVS